MIRARRSPTYRAVSDPADNTFLITNPEAAFRRYRGLELTANKRMSNRWQMQASWVDIEDHRHYNNTSSFGNSAEYDEPNFDPALQPIPRGRLTNDNTPHREGARGLSRALGHPDVRGVLLHLRAAIHPVRSASGLPQGNTDFFAEPRGGQTLRGAERLDLRLEKQFRVGGDREAGAHVRRFQPHERCGDHRPQHAFVGDVLLPAHEPPGSAALPDRRDLPLLVAPAVHSEARFSFERRAFS